mmetsp:Transcript_7600/g.14047  ORF Transcript_7600/g.14047 Transcript_7600/m.14047 type:complete len:276 (+) Transcript_7600:2329-3156(+)
MSYQPNDLNRFSQSHLIRENSRYTVLVQTRQPTNTFQLVVLQVTSIGQVWRLHKDWLGASSNLSILYQCRFERLSAVSLGFLFRRPFGIASFSLFTLFRLFHFLTGVLRHGSLEFFQIPRDEVAIFRRFGKQKVELTLSLMDVVVATSSVLVFSLRFFCAGYCFAVFGIIQLDISRSQSRLKKHRSSLCIVRLFVRVSRFFLFFFLFQIREQGILFLGTFRFDGLTVIVVFLFVFAVCFRLFEGRAICRSLGSSILECPSVGGRFGDALGAVLGI